MNKHRRIVSERKGPLLPRYLDTELNVEVEEELRMPLQARYFDEVLVKEPPRRRGKIRVRLKKRHADGPTVAEDPWAPDEPE